MAIPRIYQNSPLDKTVQLTTLAMQHVVTVLRLTTGAPVILFNGDNYEYHGELELLDKRNVRVNIQKKIFVDRESPLKIHLAQGIARGEKMDFIIQKAVELGVDEITPIFTVRCNVKLDQDRLLKRLAHWQQVAISAAEQCGRNTITLIHRPCDFSHFIAHCVGEYKFILSHRAEKNLNDSAPGVTQCTLVVGPEGGFDPQELQQAQQHTFTPLLLGPRILRTETAALVAVSLLQGRFGDL